MHTARGHAACSARLHELHSTWVVCMLRADTRTSCSSCSVTCSRFDQTCRSSS
jgi:hypothetical protein